jgi:hypothetical protein
VDPVPAGAFQPLTVPATGARPAADVGLEPDHASAARLARDATLVEPGDPPTRGPVERPRTDQPEAEHGSARKPPKDTLRGQATFYHHGTTAMRLPRGTTVIVCGEGGCITRVVGDYGPTGPERIVDLYVDDFFEICDCPSWSGVTDVTVYVY